jgi:hypothetical protein
MAVNVNLRMSHLIKRLEKHQLYQLSSLEQLSCRA